MDWKDRLIKEKSLLSVYLKARKVASAPINTRTAWSVFVVITIAMWATNYFDMYVASYASLIAGIREVADAGFVLTTAILGFLIAGFAIFASITKPAVFILLAKLDHKKENISRLQFIFFNFLLVFIHFLTFLSLCVIVKITLYKNGTLSEILHLEDDNCMIGHFIGASVIFAVMASWLVFLLMLLKSFIWNLYQAVLVTILTEAELEEQGVDRNDQ